jgi:hypothetical protein
MNFTFFLVSWSARPGLHEQLSNKKERKAIIKSGKKLLALMGKTKG